MACHILLLLFKQPVYPERITKAQKLYTGMDANMHYYVAHKTNIKTPNVVTRAGRRISQILRSSGAGPKMSKS